VHDEGGRLSLAAVDAAAEAVGLAPGMPLADGRALAPGLKTAELRPAEDARALAELTEWCGRYTPWSAVDPAGAGLGGGPASGAGILLDVTGCAGLFGGDAALLADLMTRLGRLGFAARAALADTIGAAWAVARFATDARKPWRVVPPGGARRALAALPPAALRLPPAAGELLERLGLRRIDALAGLPPKTLESRFGPALARRLRQALGTVPEVLSPLVPVPPLLACQVLAEPIVTIEALAYGLDVLAAKLCRRLEAGQRGARRLELTVYRVDGSLRRLALGTSRPSRDPDHLKQLFTGQLARIDPGFGIEVMTLSAPASERLTALQLVLGPAGAGRRGGGGLAGLVDRLEARLGAGRVVRQDPVESRLPERAVRRVPALAPGGPVPWRRGRPRPLRLFTHPEVVEAVALLPDHPPAHFRWRRVQHKVVRAEGPERIVPEWWLDDESRAGALARDYFRVEDEVGRRYWLYRAGGRWFIHGLFG
jgi:protein ImuB